MKNRYNFDFSINRRLTHSYKWDVDCKTISLSIADTDFLVPKEISDAIKKRSDLGTYGYTYVPNEYYDAYIYWWKNRHNTLLKREWFTFSTSVVASIDVIIKRLSKENDGVSLFSPNYNVFYNCILNNHRVIKEVPLIYKEDYEIDFSLLEEALKESKIFILCNPHNPIGRRFSEEEIIRIVDLCKKYDVYLISDEIHADLDYNEERYVPLLKVSDYEKGITLLSPSKVFNVAGLHSSVVVSPNIELLNIIEKGLGEDDVGEPSYFSIEPVIEAFTNCEEYVNEENEYIKINREEVINFIKDNDLKIRVVGGRYTYLLWLDISFYSKDTQKFVDGLKDKAKVVVGSGVIYHEYYSNFIRINIATQKVIIKEFLNRLNDYLKENY